MMLAFSLRKLSITIDIQETINFWKCWTRKDDLEEDLITKIYETLKKSTVVEVKEEEEDSDGEVFGCGFRIKKKEK